MKQPFNKTLKLSAVHFSTYTSEEIREMSVMRIERDVSLDTLRNPVEGGLYDERMGPIEIGRKCNTCSQSFFYCPGHFGRIELPHYVFNPLYMVMCVRMLNNSCFHCNRFRFQIEEVETCRRRLKQYLDKKRYRDMQKLKEKFTNSCTFTTCYACRTTQQLMRVVSPTKVVYVSRKRKHEGAEKVVTAEECVERMRLLYENNSQLLALLFNPNAKRMEDILEKFFIKVVPVTPNKFRPMSHMNGETYDNPQNNYYTSLIKNCFSIMSLEKRIEEEMGSEVNDSGMVETLRRRVDVLLQAVQKHVNSIYDSTDDKTGSAAAGVRQIIEKKEGLLRNNMMGKRVNFSARSVISSDPYLSTNEVGVPEIFAKKLTFPEHVTTRNIEEMKKLVRNGQAAYPGASHLEHNGTITNLEYLKDDARAQLADSIDVSTAKVNVVVHRNMKNGDMVLFNRQPTLHKPSMMAHKCRILKDENAMRIHYANCGSYNADFDGDEMNLHAVQNKIGSVEARLIANADQQYLVPKSGDPIRGLIQDHIIAAVQLTKKDTFLTEEEFDAFNVYGVKPRSAILRPRLYTGKQLLASTVESINVMPNVCIKSKAQMWYEEENQLTVKHNYYVSGVMDKAHLGASSMCFVHAFYEIYGAAKCGELLTRLTRVFNVLLLRNGFTCSLEDLMLGEDAERSRLEAENMTDAVKRCMPHGLVKPFPDNNMTLMVACGAKGSDVNTSQISVMLGKQEIEGRSVPPMQSGKTLPSFLANDTSPRANGFVSQRFLTGISLQEYFFHTMAGREGLLDTTCKTSKSGYLQRCVVKHMEDVYLSYDGTVRDSNNGIVQFVYGEDGLDVCKQRYLTNFEFLEANNDTILRKYSPRECLDVLETKRGVRQYFKHVEDPTRVPPPIIRLNPGVYLGAVSSKYAAKMESFVSECKVKKKHTEEDCKKTRALLWLRYAFSLCEPGEAVGILAAQSVAEPATQMTLNTFHFAGVSEMNVTLGVPRLRELLMTNGKGISTPIMIVGGTNLETVCKQLTKKKIRNFVSKAVLHKSAFTSSIDLELHTPLNVETSTLWTKIAAIVRRSISLHTKATLVVERKEINDEANHEAIKEANNEANHEINEAINETNEINEANNANKEINQEETAADVNKEIGIDNEGEEKDTNEIFSSFFVKDVILNDTELRVSFSGVMLAPLEEIYESILDLVVKDVRGIERCFVANNSLNVVGINLPEIWAQATLDQDSLYTNDVYTFMLNYGIEAARALLIREVRSIYKAYGINVDLRHLTVVADYLTQTGDYVAFNRTGISEKLSPFHKMSFETTYAFVKEAASWGACDTIKSPSAQIVVGENVTIGTGLFDVIKANN